MSTVDVIGYLKIAVVSALPTPSSSLQGVLVVMSGNLYYCDGNQWHKLTPALDPSDYVVIGNMVD
ncbi:MAG: hypothetical protein RML40_12375 [Bacteroidota bacterium]|nr:hypothetical protein [Bacteroidota bacterium]